MNIRKLNKSSIVFATFLIFLSIVFAMRFYIVYIAYGIALVAYCFIKYGVELVGGILFVFLSGWFLRKIKSTEKKNARAIKKENNKSKERGIDIVETLVFSVALVMFIVFGTIFGRAALGIIFGFTI